MLTWTSSWSNRMWILGNVTVDDGNIDDERGGEGREWRRSQRTSLSRWAMASVWYSTLFLEVTCTGRSSSKDARDTNDGRYSMRARYEGRREKEANSFEDVDALRKVEMQQEQEQLSVGTVLHEAEQMCEPTFDMWVAVNNRRWNILRRRTQRARSREKLSCYASSE